MRYLAHLILLATAYIIALLLLPSPVIARSAEQLEEEAPFLFAITITDVDERSLIIASNIRLRLMSLIPPPEFCCTLENRYGRASEGIVVLNISRMSYGEKPFVRAYVYYFDVQVRLRPFGPRELYPHDSYLLNMSFVFEDGGLASTDLIKLEISCDKWTWQARGRFELRRASPRAAVIVEVILERVTPFFTPYYVALFTSSLLLGASLFMGPDALASRLALYLSLLFSMMSLLGQVSSTAPEERAFSLAEYLLMDVCVATSLLCVESVLEYLSYEHLSPGAYKRAQVALKLLFSSASALLFTAHFLMFSSASALFPWTSVPLSDFAVPGASMLFFALMASYTEHKKARPPPPLRPPSPGASS